MSLASQIDEVLDEDTVAATYASLFFKNASPSLVKLFVLFDYLSPFAGSQLNTVELAKLTSYLINNTADDFYEGYRAKALERLKLRLELDATRGLDLMVGFKLVQSELLRLSALSV